jgi:hypothetical protein
MLRSLILAAAALAVAGPAAAAASPRGMQAFAGVWSAAEGNLYDPKAGLDGNREGVRLYPPYKPGHEARYSAQIAANRTSQADPTATCLPPGVPRLWVVPFPFEIMVAPDRVTIIHEMESQVRRIYTDGRDHPDELDPSFNGHSIGRWEGDTLVVDTVGLRGDTVFDRTVAHHSDKMRVRERLRLAEPDLLEVQITVEDPEVFTRPWTVTRHYDRQPGWEIQEYVCLENNRETLLTRGDER